MTELQIAIAAAAASVIVWILYVNLRERAALKKAAAEQSQSAEPIFTAAQAERPDADLPSEFSEAIAVLTWPSPISVIRVQQQIRGWRRVGSKPLSIGWVSADSVLTEPVGLELSELRVGILLATRSGALHAMEYSEWRDTLDQIATALGAGLEVPSMTVVLARAKELDQKCAAVDAQLSLCVTTDRVLSVGDMQSAALALGLQPKGESRFVFLDEQQQTRFSVFPGDRGNSMVLLLDVPRSPQPTESFKEMTQTAHQLAQSLNGRLTDEAGRELTTTDLDMIAAQVAQRAEQLLELGITPGSRLALRLFL